MQRRMEQKNRNTDAMDGGRMLEPGEEITQRNGWQEGGRERRRGETRSVAHSPRITGMDSWRRGNKHKHSFRLGRLFEYHNGAVAARSSRHLFSPAVCRSCQIDRLLIDPCRSRSRKKTEREKERDTDRWIGQDRAEK